MMETSETVTDYFTIKQTSTVETVFCLFNCGQQMTALLLASRPQELRGSFMECLKDFYEPRVKFKEVVYNILFIYADNLALVRCYVSAAVTQSSSVTCRWLSRLYLA